MSFGATPLGADWTCVLTQEMRFVQLLKLCDVAQPFSINDIGCGYGALRNFLGREQPGLAIDYLGIDISDEMIRLASMEIARYDGSAVVMGSSSPRIADYSVASGIFNVCLEHDRDAWEAMIEATLREMAETSRRGFAVNLLAPAHPLEPIKHGLYRTDPARWVEYCQRLGHVAEIVGGYGMNEFTLIAR